MTVVARVVFEQLQSQAVPVKESPSDADSPCNSFADYIAELAGDRIVQEVHGVKAPSRIFHRST